MMSVVSKFVASRKAVGFIFSAGCVLRLLLLGGRSLWFDEANTFAAAGVSLDRLLPVVRTMEGAPPLYYLLIHFWLGLFSDPLFALRAFSALCGIAALAAFISLCERLIPEDAGFAAFLGAFSSFWIHFSQEGRAYSLFLLVAILQMHLLLRLKDHWSAKEGVAYAALGVLGLYTHNFFPFFLLSNFLYLCFRCRAKLLALVPWLAVYGAILVLYLPWLSSVKVQVRSWSAISALETPLALGQFCSLLGTMLFDISFLSFTYPRITPAIGALILLLSGGGLLMGLRRKGDDRELSSLCLVHLVVPFAAAKALELVLGRPLTQARYFIFLSPFLYIGLAAGLGNLRRLRPALALLVLAGTAGYLASGIYADPRLSSLSGFIRGQADRRLPVVHLAAFYYTPMRFYYLPERAHFLAGETDRMLNWGALPGYGAVIAPERLYGLGNCVVVDPERRHFPRRVGLASGRQLVAKGPR